MTTNNPNFIPERTGVNSLGTRTEPWERANTEEIGSADRVIKVSDIATVADTPVNTPNLMPTPRPFIDNGKIVVAMGGALALVPYPKSLPPTTTEDAGKLLRIGMDGVPRLEDCANLPETTLFDEGATLRVVGGQIQVRRGNAHGELNPTPIAPEEDGMTIVSRNGQWVLASVHEQYVLPPIGPEDIGKFVVLTREDGEAPVEIKYVDPPMATGTTIGAIPALSGNANQYLNGNLEWKMVTPGNNGHYRLGDIKPTTRPVEDPWLPCLGDGLGSQPSGAKYHGDQYRRLYAMIDGTQEWTQHWDDNVQVYLPSIPWCQICYLPDAQAPAPFAAIFEASYANGLNSFFEIQFSKDKSIWNGPQYNSSTHSAFWRLGGDFPSQTNFAGDAYPIDGESLMFDVSEVMADFSIGAWYWRVRQRTGATFDASTALRWQYGTSVVTGG